MLRAHDNASIQKRLSFRVISGSDAELRILRQLNAAIFPLAYHDKFYKDLAASCGDLYCRAVFVYIDDRELIGTFSCRLESPPLSEPEYHKVLQCAYLMTFGLLAKYRMRGVGEWMWQRVMEMYGGYELMVLHVQVGNVPALRFYKKRGFVEQAVVKDYYKRLSPPDAVLLTRRTNQDL